MENCQICGQPLKQIPAGVSKATGKPYQAFTACPNKCPKPNWGGNAGKPVNPSYTPTPITKPRDFDSENFGKCKHAFLVEAFKKEMKLSEAEEWAEQWASASMRKLRAKTTIQDPEDEIIINDPF